MRIMNLMTNELRRKLPPLYATENVPVGQKRVQASYFMPDGNWYWYPIEFDGEDICFGLVAGKSLELGYFSLAELRRVRGAWGLPVERDTGWTPVLCREVIERYRDYPGASVLLS